MYVTCDKYRESREYDQGIFVVKLDAQEAHDLWQQFEALRQYIEYGGYRVDKRHRVSARLQDLLAEHITGMHIGP